MLPRPQPEATLVVCEDDVPTLDLLCDHLHADRFEALPAPSAADALRLCHYNDPDLLLLDIRLPDASGLDVLREIRASAGPTGRFDPGLPIIVLSGKATDVDRVRGLEAGADDYVIKLTQCSSSRARRKYGEPLLLSRAKAGVIRGPNASQPTSVFPARSRSEVPVFAAAHALCLPLGSGLGTHCAVRLRPLTDHARIARHPGCVPAPDRTGCRAIHLLSHWVDDYLTKPFSCVEMLARLRALARRCPVERPMGSE